MKTLVLSVLAILGMGLATAQETPVELEDVTLSSKNAKFLNTVKDENSPDFAIELQLHAAHFDLLRSPYYEGDVPCDYLIRFQTAQGNMYATYNEKGDIIKCLEKYNDVVLPNELRQEVIQDHRGWRLDDSQYTSVYKNERLLKKEYKVKLKNGDIKKTVIVDLRNHNEH